MFSSIEKTYLLAFIIKFGKNEWFINKYGNLSKMSYSEKDETYFKFMLEQEKEFLDEEDKNEYLNY